MEREIFNAARDAWFAALVREFGEKAAEILAYSSYGKGDPNSEIRKLWQAKNDAHRAYLLTLV